MSGLWIIQESDGREERGVVLKIGSGITLGKDVDGIMRFSVSGSDVDHGALDGLADDDHTQYLLEDGSRASSGEQDFQGGLKVSTAQAYDVMKDNGAKTTSWTLDWNQGNVQFVNVTGGGAITISFSNNDAGSVMVLVLRNGSGGALGAHTWDSEIKWAGGDAPTLPGNGAAIVVTFVCLSGTETIGSFSDSAASVSDI